MPMFKHRHLYLYHTMPMFERADVWMGIANEYVWLYAPKKFTTTSANIPEKLFSQKVFSKRNSWNRLNCTPTIRLHHSYKSIFLFEICLSYNVFSYHLETFLYCFFLISGFTREATFLLQYLISN